MTTIEEFAQKLNGRKYGKEITNEECKEAKKLGFVIMFGASDDLFELRGAIKDETDSFQGTAVQFFKGKMLGDLANKLNLAVEDILNVLTELELSKELCLVIAHWCPEKPECSWLIEPVNMPFASFDIVEDGEIYCRGAVVELKSLGGINQ
jgi:hypothetical protein